MCSTMHSDALSERRSRPLQILRLACQDSVLSVHGEDGIFPTIYLVSIGFCCVRAHQLTQDRSPVSSVSMFEGHFVTYRLVRAIPPHAPLFPRLPTGPCALGATLLPGQGTLLEDRAIPSSCAGYAPQGHDRAPWFATMTDPERIQSL